MHSHLPYDHIRINNRIFTLKLNFFHRQKPQFNVDLEREKKKKTKKEKDIEDESLTGESIERLFAKS